MKRLCHKLLLCALLSIPLSSLAQGNPHNDLSLNRAALRYFSGVELNTMENEHPAHYAALLYYFTNSFGVQPVNCQNCEVDYTEFYNRELFNVREFESLRLHTEEFTFVYRDTYHITLYPTQQIENAMGMSVQEVIRKDMRPLPRYVESGNADLDLANYKLAMKAWILDFPEEYRAITARSGVLHIPYLEFIGLSNDRKNDLNSRPNAYLLID